MAASWQLLLYQDKELVHTATLIGPVELGREKGRDETLYSQQPQSGGQRLVIAHKDEKSVSRQHALIEPLPEGGFRLTNLSDERPIGLPDGAELTTKAACAVPANALLTIGKKTLRLQAAAEETPPLNSLAEATAPPGRSSHAAASQLGLPTTPAAGAEKKVVVSWIQAAMDVLQSAANSADFFEKAARAVVELVRLDSGRVLLLKGEEWPEQALHMAPRLAGEAAGTPSRHVLNRVRQERRTFWQAPGPSLPDAASLREVDAVVAAPILDRNGTVIGALYGDRRLASGPSSGGPITEGEALLVELLARGVAAGLARLEQEQAALVGQRKLLRMEADLQIGRSIQVGFLPEELPQVAGWEVGAYFRPAREVGGDFYDLFLLPHDHLGVVIADVCGKGVGAALYMTLYRSLLRAFAEQTFRRELFGRSGLASSLSASPAGGRRAALRADLTALSAIELTNDYVARTHASAIMFASAFFGVLDVSSGALSYVNAGHKAPVLVNAGGIKGRLSKTGHLVGVKPDEVYDINRVVLDPGDTLLAYTDGITEALDPGGGFFSVERLLSIIEAPAPSVNSLLDRLVGRLDEHIAGADPSDDVTMLAVRRNG